MVYPHFSFLISHSSLKQCFMAQIAKASKATKKREAYQKKQEDSGKKVLEWIFGVLVVLAIIFVIYSIFIVS